MLRSMFAGVAGLRNHQIKMDVIGNNIANVNTYGFKASRVTFKEMYAQTIQAATGPSGAAGGINPKQIGLGTATAAVDVIHEGGGAQTTDRALDVRIDGEGFFQVKQDNNTYYTRTGNFYLDPNGYLVTDSGMYVQGIMFMNPSEAGADAVDGAPRPSEDVIAAWDADSENIKPQDVSILDEPFPTDGTENELTGRIVIPTTYYNINVNKDGSITALNESGQIVTVGMVLTNTFVNPSGLERTGNNLYMESLNSGTPTLSKPGFADAGTIQSGQLEMSNVDLSKEFTDMIITQRGFQANSRVITVSDTLLEELVNLKR